MRPELPYRVHAPFFGPQPFPDSNTSIRAPSPDLVAYDLNTESLRRVRFPAPKPRQLLAGATDIPYADAVTASLNDAQVARTFAPQKLRDARPLTHVFLSALPIVVALQWEHSDSASIAMIVVKPHRTSECACREYAVSAHAQRADDAFHARCRTAASRARGVHPADGALSILLDIERADTAVASGEELVGILGREE